MMAFVRRAHATTTMKYESYSTCPKSVHKIMQQEQIGTLQHRLRRQINNQHGFVISAAKPQNNFPRSKRMYCSLYA